MTDLKQFRLLYIYFGKPQDVRVLAYSDATHANLANLANLLVIEEQHQSCGSQKAELDYKQPSRLWDNGISWCWFLDGSHDARGLQSIPLPCGFLTAAKAYNLSHFSSVSWWQLWYKRPTTYPTSLWFLDDSYDTRGLKPTPLPCGRMSR